MEEKESFTPEEVAEMCRAYHSLYGGKEKESYDSHEAAKMCIVYHSVYAGWHDFPISDKEVIKKYEETVPKNIRDLINVLTELERAARQKRF